MLRAADVLQQFFLRTMYAGMVFFCIDGGIFQEYNGYICVEKRLER